MSEPCTIDVAEGVQARRALAALAPFHYRLGTPATIAQVLVARMRYEVVGVLVVSNPTLNAPWRRVAWPEAFGPGLTKRAFADESNRLVRTISRVIVDPRVRGMGVARDLVATYLRSPITPCTEAIAAMAAWCPFFQAAGMREVGCPASERHAAFARALDAAGVEAWRLLDLNEGRRVLRALPAIECALRRWLASGRGSAALRRRRSAPREQLLALAASACVARPVVLVTP